MSTVRGILEQFFRQFEASFEAINSVELSKSALLFNFDLLKKLYRAEHVIPVLKSNAYGHGMEPILKILEEREAPLVAVDSYHEALEVRAVSDFDVLVMGAVLPENFSKIETRHVTYVIQDMSALNVLTNSRHPLKIHLEFNTGLNRQGFEEDELKDILAILKDNSHIELDGVMTQLYDASNPDQKASKAQIKQFDSIVERVLKAGLEPRYIHLAKTDGLTDATSRYANTIRPGGGIFGINILPEKHPFFDQLDQLKPVLGLYSRVVKLRELAAGQGVSYGHTFRTKRQTRTAVVPLGYAEGIPRLLSNRGAFAYKGELLPIIGNVAMNHTIVDVTESRVKLWDRVTGISPNRDAPNSVNRLFKDHGLYKYETLVGISADLRRKIID
jgi:alanine racemase